MKKLLLSLFGLLPVIASAAPCLPSEALIKLDSQYEEALRTGDVPFLQSLLADDYVWVHTLGTQIETRDILLARLAKPVVYKARSTSDVHVHVQGDTSVVRGVSTTEQWNQDGATFRSNRYQFMRTYVKVAGKCKLLSVQTMNLK
ncbi:nuclear transport factor 2 family protein [Duganella sp. sic0402]|uniref:nuclear transport factor 2 family protein n=1 Tax=Duganella sp. sic0402 TaxID=2854786 RepID=UPI001C48D011|nr:nuclear transport factor 2 family protein [Duganella sp. sic0402]MBV7534880.1 nuclear transport factor 2 family protein [Duganella sp. sic0402]